MFKSIYLSCSANRLNTESVQHTKTPCTHFLHDSEVITILTQDDGAIRLKKYIIVISFMMNQKNHFCIIIFTFTEKNVCNHHDVTFVGIYNKKTRFLTSGVQDL